MQAHKFPARQGWVWLQAGFALWRSAPLALTGSAMTMLMCLLLAAMIPFVGELAFQLLLPVLGVGFFTCCQAVAQRRTAPPSLLFARFRERLPRLAGLGILCLLCGLACTTLANFIMGQAPATPVSSQTSQELTRIIEQALPAAGLSVLLYSPMALATWFAAPLIALHRIPLQKALFFSLMACLRNFGALLVFVLLFCFVGGFSVGLLTTLLSAIAPQLTSVLLAPAIMVLLPLFHAAFYISARDIFGEWPSA